MPRPHADPKIKARAFEIYKLVGPKPSAILGALETEFGPEAVSLRTISTWLSNFKELDTRLDDPFEWHRIGDYQLNGWGLSWESGEYLLMMQAYVESQVYTYDRAQEVMGTGTKGELPDTLTGPPRPPYNQLMPTVRQACWWWRVHLAARDMDMEKVWIMGTLYAIRELVSQLSRERLELGDLDAYLVHKPWEGESQESRYRRLIAQGRIPAIRSNPERLAAAMLQKNGEQMGVWIADPLDWSFTFMTTDSNEEKDHERQD